MEDVFILGNGCSLFKEYLEYFYSKNNNINDILKYEEVLERFIIIRNLFPISYETVGP